MSTAKYLLPKQADTSGQISMKCPKCLSDFAIPQDVRARFIQELRAWDERFESPRAMTERLLTIVAVICCPP